MRKLIIPFVVLLIFLMADCSLVDKLIPDVDTDFTQTFYVNIDENKGQTGTKNVDVTTMSDYEDFKGNIHGFELRKITYEIKDYDAPDDLYFTGTVNVWNADSTESFRAADIGMTNLSKIAGGGEQDNVDKIVKGTDKVMNWLESPGNFNMNAGYSLTDASGKPYTIPEKGYHFTLILKFYVTVITGTK